MGWQRHTVRGFMAGAMKKAGYSIESFKPEGGEGTLPHQFLALGAFSPWPARRCHAGLFYFCPNTRCPAAPRSDWIR